MGDLLMRVCRSLATFAVYIYDRVRPMNRRETVHVFLGLALAPLAAYAQQAGRVYRLGMLYASRTPSVADQQRNSNFLLPGALRDLGYVEGRNLAIERRFAEGKLERLPVLARELVQLRADVIVAVGASATLAVKAASAKIPIVLYGNIDPVALGLVSNLARPGGSITGVLIAPGGTLAGKKLELLKNAVQRAGRIALLAPTDPGFAGQLRETQAAAASLGVELPVVEVRNGDFERAFAAVAALRTQALFVGAHQSFMADRKRIIELAATHRLPAIYEWPEQAEDGGLMAYGTSLSAIVQRIAAYVDLIFKGANPGELPIEQPSRFELAINLKTAKALGLTIPQTLLVRADRVIE
jgi:putative ABC transport system substrate-binding protein